MNKEEEADSDTRRFRAELEFVQSLANPHYCHWLAQQGYFKDKAFLNYLEYLNYWKKPEYAKYLDYPQSLAMLDILRHKETREEFAKPQYVAFVRTQLQLFRQFGSLARSCDTTKLKS